MSTIWGKGGVQKIVKSDFLKKAFTLVTGTTIAQAVSILTAPILTRLYSPESYGLLGYYMMATGIVGALSTCQYHNAIILEKDDRRAMTALELSLTTTILIASLAAVVFFFGYKSINEILNSPQLGKWLWWGPVSIFFTGWNISFMAWANRNALFKMMSFNRILTAILVPTVSISLALIINDPLGLLAGLLISQVVPAVALGYFFLKRSGGYHLGFKRAMMIELARKHKKFPTYTLPVEFISNFVNQVPVFVLGRSFGLNIVGNFNLSNRMLGLPTQLISNSVSEVFRHKATKIYHEMGRCDNIFIKTFSFLCLGAVIPFLLIVLLGPDLFVFVFGEQWRQAGEISRIMAPMFFLRFIISPLTYVLFISSKQVIDFIGTVVYFLSSILVAFLVMRFSGDLNTFLIAYVSNFAWIYLVMFFLSYKYSKGVI